MTHGSLIKITAAASVMLVASGLAVIAQNSPNERLDNRRMFKSGQEAFEKVCARCHTGRADAVGPDLLKNAYDADTVKFFVRHGSGPMPAFTESMIDNATLDELAHYVATHGKGAPQ